MQNLRSGSTAVVGMVTDSHLHMGWTGGSQIVLVRRGIPIHLHHNHINLKERYNVSYTERDIGD